MMRQKKGQGEFSYQFQVSYRVESQKLEIKTSNNKRSHGVIKTRVASRVVHLCGFLGRMNFQSRKRCRGIGQETPIQKRFVLLLFCLDWYEMYARQVQLACLLQRMTWFKKRHGAMFVNYSVQPFWLLETHINFYCVLTFEPEKFDATCSKEQKKKKKTEK